MKVIIFGATGMIGAGTLRECLDDPRVQSVLVVGRSSVGVGILSPKLQEIRHTDFFDYAPLQSRFADCDACFFCLGVSAVGMTEDSYRHLTYDLTLAAAKSMVAVNPRMTFCYISGAGTDSTGQGRAMWARVKGRTENALLALGFKAAFMFRPGLILPLKGVRSKTRLYQAIYTALVPLYPMLRRLPPRYITTTVDVGRALIAVAAHGYPRPFIEMDDIHQLSAVD